jgi:hypothetical protein
MPNLPCEDGAGSLNNPNGSAEQTGLNNPALKPYTPPSLTTGEWQISSLSPDACANSDQIRQETYVAESLNISGAPINIFKLLGVHEQGNGSLAQSAAIIASAPSPGYPVSYINSGTSSWKSLQTGSAVIGTARVGFDFGIRRLASGSSEYKPEKSKLTKIGALHITQANTPNEFARQVKVEITDGSCELGNILSLGVGDGSVQATLLGADAADCSVSFVAATSDSFDVFATFSNGTLVQLGTAQVGLRFNSTVISTTIVAGAVPFEAGDTFIIPISYVWKRIGIFNLIQSPLAQTLNLNVEVLVRAVRITPTLFTGTGGWEVLALDVLDSAQTNINNIQDLFLGENRDRDYSKIPSLLKVQYSPSDSISDLSKFGLSILDQYSFTASFASVVKLLGRPIVVGDIIEVIPEMQYDQNLKPIRKFLEVTDTSWASDGYSTMWKPTLIRFVGQQALPSQETRDIFGTLDTQKYLVADSVLSGGIGEQLDTSPLTQVEELQKAASNKVPKTGSDDELSTMGVPLPVPVPNSNAKGQPAPAKVANGKPGIYIEDGLPPNGETYGEGFKLPEPTDALDGDYFRLNYPPEQKIPARLYRFSAIKNRWIYQETDRRGEYSSHKPSIRSILESNTKQGLGKKTT